METELGVRHRRRPPTIHRGTAQQTISAGATNPIGNKHASIASLQHVSVRLSTGSVPALNRVSLRAQVPGNVSLAVRGWSGRVDHALIMEGLRGNCTLTVVPAPGVESRRISP